MNKYKILVISDHALSPSGVGVQTKVLIEGLIKTQRFKFIQLGAAIKHSSYNTVAVNDDFLIKPIDGFGTPELLRSVLLNEQPDALFIFTDPRFFEWLFKMEDEIKQVCPILWWHVWDNKPYPDFNEWMYNATDAINCHSYLTYKLCKEKFPNKTSFIPHTYPKSMFYKLDKEEIIKRKTAILGEKRKNNFVCLWINRNCKRKRPADVLYSWKLFIDLLDDSQKDKSTLVLHTNPTDNAGQNLFEIAKKLNILDYVAFSTEKINTEEVNTLHNIADVCLNISFNEGFGLTTLESMMTGTPIIATKTGGLYRQVIDYKDDSENGIGLEPKIKTIAGTQNIPYIFEDYVDCNDVAKALLTIKRLNENEKLTLSNKVLEYANEAFDYNKTIKLWKDSFIETIEKHKCQEKISKMVIEKI